MRTFSVEEGAGQVGTSLELLKLALLCCGQNWSDPVRFSPIQLELATIYFKQYISGISQNTVELVISCSGQSWNSLGLA